ncbi:MAG: class I SAM-dependent methyltransferase [Myxococcota bacterium]
MRDRKTAERRFAEFYSSFAADFSQDLPVYRELAAKYAGPVLEVGCRTGRVARQLAAAGHEVCAVDTSRPMLEIARAKLARWGDRVRLAGFDLRQGALFDGFRVVIATHYAFNSLIEIEEQRLFLRHVSRSMSSPGVLAIDFFCPLSIVRPDAVGQWRVIERRCGELDLACRDKREMLTPLLERRTQVFSIGAGPECEFVSYRRYVPPQQAASLLGEAGFESVRWVEGYDLSSARPVEDSDRPKGPFMLLGER